MPDLKTILSSLSPNRAIANARRETVEQARIHAELDALTSRIAPAEKASLPELRRAS